MTVGVVKKTQGIAHGVGESVPGRIAGAALTRKPVNLRGKAEPYQRLRAADEFISTQTVKTFARIDQKFKRAVEGDPVSAGDLCLR